MSREGRSARFASVWLACGLLWAGCSRPTPDVESPGWRWTVLQSAIDSLGAEDRVDAALALVESAPAGPGWFDADLAAMRATLRRRGEGPSNARRTLQAADAASRRVVPLMERDSLAASYALAREVSLARNAAYGPADPLALRATVMLAIVTFRMARVSECDSLARDVLARLPVGARETHPLAADAEQILGRIRKNFEGISSRREALGHYERALAIQQTAFGPRSLEVALVHQDIGNLERAAKRVPEARAHLTRALEIRRERLGPKHEEVASNYSALAHLSASLGDWQAAERSMRASLAASPDSLGSSPIKLTTRLSLLGQALRRSGRVGEALIVLRDAAAAADRAWARLPQDGASSVQSGLSVHRELAFALAEAGDAEAAFVQLEQSYARTWVLGPTAETWSGLLARVQGRLPEGAALVAWPRSTLAPPGGDYPMWACLVRADQPVRWLRIERPSGWPRTGDTTREALGKELLRASNWPLRLTDHRAVDSLSRVAGRELFAPLEPHLRGIRELIVASPELMAATPLALLRDERGALLSDRYTISYVPSALVYVTLAERVRATPSPRAARALLVGAPMAAPGDSGRWASLLGAAGELRELADVFPRARVLAGREANAGALRHLARRGELAQFDVLHLATHVDVDAKLGRPTAFVLAADASSGSHASRLTADEIRDRWRMRASLVSLAGCRSAVGMSSASEGWLGLQQSFLSSGARNVLVSLWRVDDAATARLMVEFHSRYVASGDAPLALREAQRAVREYRTHEGLQPFAHPVYWAGFAVVGEG